MRLSGRKTAPVFARYDIVSPNELRDAAAKLGARGADDTIRLYMVPGMQPGTIHEWNYTIRPLAPTRNDHLFPDRP